MESCWGRMILACHIGEYFGNTLDEELRGYEKCREWIITCWNRLYRGTLLRLVFSQLCPLSGVGDLMGILDHMSGNVAHVAVPAGKLRFLGKSRSNPFSMGEGVGGRFGLALTNVDFREPMGNGKLLGEDDICKPHG